MTDVNFLLNRETSMRYLSLSSRSRDAPSRTRGLCGAAGIVRKRLRRFCGWNPATPLANPRTQSSSYHIVRVLDDDVPEFCLDLLFRDSDAYLVAFRRRKLVDGQWSGNCWFRYKGILDLPHFIEENAIPLNFRCSHSTGIKTSPRNRPEMKQMFRVLSSFEDKERDPNSKMVVDVLANSQCQDSLLIAIVIFSEAYRFRSIYRKMLVLDEDRYLTKAEMKLIHKWGFISTEIFKQWHARALEVMHNPPPEKVQNAELTVGNEVLRTAGDLIDKDGELLLILIQREVVEGMIDLEELSEDVLKRGEPPIREPDF